MTVEGLEQLVRDSEESLHYRRQYSAEAVVSIMNNTTARLALHFVVEQDALGRSAVSVYLDSEVDYPRVPVIRALKDHIRKLDAERKLP